MILFMEPEVSVIVEFGMELSSEQMAELRELAGARDVPADVALRARIVLWSGEGRRRKDVAELAGVAPLTVDRCKARYAERGVASGGEAPRRAAYPGAAAGADPGNRFDEDVPAGGIRPVHWSTRTLADHLKRREGVSVSRHYIARIWREESLKPHRSGTFKISKDSAFAEKVADVVGLYLSPPGGVVVLSIDEKTQVQALDRTHVHFHFTPLGSS
ncbi:hypothetical protein ACFWD7_57445 [Streptomyces mirabilis]|uniref:hypothetical protein n=1 Tax=Streptomyces mirabilis TaxID=68239 RepID=UPI0036BE2F74